MTERRVFIAFFIGVAVLTFTLVRGLLSLGADSETMALAYVALACIGGFGVGGIVMHFHR